MAKYKIPVYVKNEIIKNYSEPVFNTIRESLENTGKVPEGFGGLKKYESKIISSDSKNYDQFLKDTEDEASLTDAELSERRDVFGDMGGIRQREISSDAIKSEIEKRLLNQNFEPGVARGIAESLRDQYFRHGTFAPVDSRTLAQAGKSLDKRVSRIYDSLVPELNAMADRGDFSVDIPGTEGVSPDVQRINDLLEARGFEREQNSILDETIKSLPEELAAGTKAFIGNQRESGKQFFENELAPQIAQAANTRGLLFSGDFVNELTRGAGSIQAGIENQEAGLLTGDQQFFADIAYQNTLRKAIQAGQDVSAQLATNRQNALTQKQQAFESSQADINRSFNEMLFRKQQEQQLAVQQRQLATQTANGRRQSRNEMIAGIAGTVGQIGGTVVGAKLGGAAGATKTGVT